MSKEEAISFIEKEKGNGQSIKKIMTCFGNIQNKMSFIHIAGSNGKGSVSMMLSSILKFANYKVGTFVSPHLIDYNERFLINGICINDDDFIRLATKVKSICNSNKLHLTFFEILTCMAFLYFDEQKCDVVILETGLGGRLDATNVISQSILSIITGICLEHSEILGDNLEKIANEKAGIIKNNGTCLIYDAPDFLFSLFQKKCIEKNANLYKSDYSRLNKEPFSYKNYKNIELNLKGDYQYYNACLVLDAVTILNNKGFIIDEKDVKEGLKNVCWLARMSILKTNPLFIIDGAHNIEGIKALTFSLPYHLKGEISFVIGILKDKNYKKIIELLLPYAKEFICLKPNTKRAIEPYLLKEYIISKGIKAIVYDDIYQALEYVTNKKCIVCGSLYLCGEALVAYKKILRDRCLKKITSLTKDEVIYKSKKIVAKIKDSQEFKNAKNIMIYKAYENEVDLNELEKENKTFSYPVCLNHNMMKAIIPKKGFYINKYGIKEPIGKEMKKIDLIICPIVAFDDRLYRIGHGKGYYDRFLRNYDCPLIGVAYDFCKVEKIAESCFDIRLDIIYSEDNIYKV